MAKESEKVEKGPQLETGGSSLASLVEGISFPITGHKLNSQNYTQWARPIRIFLQGKGRKNTSLVKPRNQKRMRLHSKWKLENSLVMSWLLNTMTTEIGEDFLYFSTAKRIGMQHEKLTPMWTTH